MGLFDRVTVEVLSAAFQTKQLGEGMLTYQLAEDGRLVAPCGVVVAYHGLLHLIGEDGAEFMAVFTHGRLGSAGPDRGAGRRRLPLSRARDALDAGRVVTVVDATESNRRIARQVGGAIRRLRLERGRTQRQFAAAAGIPEAALTAYEGGQQLLLEHMGTICPIGNNRTPHLWSVEEIAGLLPVEAPKKRGPYKKRDGDRNQTGADSMQRIPA